MTELMPCPWCGENPQTNEHTGYAWCESKGCHAGIPTMTFSDWNDQRGVKAAVEKALRDEDLMPMVQVRDLVEHKEKAAVEKAIDAVCDICPNCIDRSCDLCKTYIAAIRAIGDGTGGNERRDDANR